MVISASCGCQVPKESRKWALDPWDWSYSFEITVWALIIGYSILQGDTHLDCEERGCFCFLFFFKLDSFFAGQILSSYV